MARVALLDLDGTLADSAGNIRAALDRLMAAQGRPGFTRAEVIPMIGDGAEVLLRRACAARELPFSPTLFDGFLRDFEARADTGTETFPGIPDALARLRSQGWRLAVCTNKPGRAAAALLDALGLSPLLDAVGAGDSFPVRKPDPGHPLAILRRMGAAPADAVLVGDHANDVVAARGAGIAPVFAAWGYGPPAMADGAPVALSPADLPGVLDRVLPRWAPCLEDGGPDSGSSGEMCPSPPGSGPLPSGRGDLER